MSLPVHPSLLPLLSALLLLTALAVPSAASVVQVIDGVSYSFDFCVPLTFGPLCWRTTPPTMQLSYQYANGGSYIAVGFSADGTMLGGHGASAVIGWTGGPAGPFISNFDLVSQTDGGNQPGGTTLGLSQAAVSTDGGGLTTLLFTRLLNVTNADKPYASIAFGQQQYIIESHGGTPSSPQAVAFHGANHYDANLISFTTGAVTSVPDPLHQWKRAHACLMTVAFGGLIPAGIVFARFFKGYGPLWFHLHRSFVLAGLALLIIGFSIGVGKIGTGYYTTHRGIGVYVLAAMLFQPFNAVVRPHPPAVGERPTHLRLAWQALHHWNARVAYCFAIANIYIGFSILDPGSQYVVLFSVLWALVMLVAVVLQVAVLYTASLGERGEGVKVGGEKRLDQPASAPVAVMSEEQQQP